MGALEIYFGTIALIIALVGVARGYSKELGSTMIIMVGIFLLSFVEQQFNPTVQRLVTQALRGELAEMDPPFLLGTLYSTVFVAMVFAGYAGQVIVFDGRPLPPPQGTILSLLIGGLNGYLVAGTLWYFQHVYGYPLSRFGLVVPDLSPVAQALLRILPQAVVPSPTWWMIPIAVLLLMRVRG